MADETQDGNRRSRRDAATQGDRGRWPRPPRRSPATAAKTSKRASAKPRPRAAQAPGEGHPSAVKTARARQAAPQDTRPPALASPPPPSERIKTVTKTQQLVRRLRRHPRHRPFQALFADAGERGQEVVPSRRRRSKSSPNSPRRTSKRSSRPADRRRRRQLDRPGRRRSAVKASRRPRTRFALSPKPSRRPSSSSCSREFARASFDRFVAESSKLTERFVKLAGEAIQPISEPRHAQRRAHQQARCLTLSPPDQATQAAAHLSPGAAVFFFGHQRHRTPPCGAFAACHILGLMMSYALDDDRRARTGATAARRDRDRRRHAHAPAHQEAVATTRC